MLCATIAGLDLMVPLRFGPALILSFGLLIVYYLFTAPKVFFDGQKEGSGKKLKVASNLISRVVSLALAILLTGTLFRLMCWPNGEINIFAGIIMLAGVGVYIRVKELHKNSPQYNILFLRIGFFIVVGAVMANLPPYQIHEIKFKDYPALIEAIKKRDENPGNDSLARIVEEEFNKISR